MSKDRRCPACGAAWPASKAQASQRCPECGAKLQLEGEPASREDEAIAQVLAESKPRRKRKRRRPRPATGAFDVVGLLMATGAALGLFVVSFGFGHAVRFLLPAPRAVAADVRADAGPKERPLVQPPVLKKPGSPSIAIKPVPRPEASAGDRTAVKRLVLGQPPAWSMPQEKIPVSEPLVSSIAAFPGEAFFSGAQAAQAAVLTLRRHETPHPRWGVQASRFDLHTGSRLGEEVELWPWFKGAEDATLNAPPPNWALAALSMDGERLALRDPSSHDRVDVWDTSGKRLIGLRPIPGAMLEWIGWSANNYLLTIGQGQLMAWDLPGGRAVYDVSISSPNVAAALSPGRTWLAIGTKGGVYAIDTATGRGLGRLDVGNESAWGWIALALSSDGQRLCGVIRHPPPAFAPAGIYGWLTRWNDNKPAGELVWSTLWDVCTWDLTTGHRSNLFPIWTDVASPQWNPLHWCGANYVLLGGRNLIDLEHRVVSRSYAPPSQAIVSGSPDGRLWYLDPSPVTEAKAVTLRAYRPPSPADATVVCCPGTAVVVTCEGAGPERDKQFAATLRILLDHEGYKSGPGGWTMRVKTEIFDTLERLPQDAANGPTVPAILITIRWINPQGKEAGSEAYSAVFQRKQSKYYVRPRTGETAEKYQFTGKEQRPAILDEIWEHLVAPTAWARWPRGVAQVGDKMFLLPQIDSLRED
jgi:hypothetical protein